MASIDMIMEAIKPTDGWFRDPATSDMIQLAAQVLLDEGISPAKVQTVVHSIILAVRSEYGE